MASAGDDIVYDKPIAGRGSYGEVWLARWNGNRVAAKRIHSIYFGKYFDQQARDYFIEQFRKEWEVLRKLEHPNIVRMLTVLFPTTKNQSPVIVTELLHCDLETFIRNSETIPKIGQKEGLSLALGVAEGLQYLHGLKPAPVVHRDLATKNILLTKEKQPKIADLGVAKIFASGKDMHATPSPGTPLYAAPETLPTSMGQETTMMYGVKVDIFSFGTVVLAIIVGHESAFWPLSHLNEDGSKISESVRRKNDIEEMGHNKMRSVVLRCLKDRSSDRPDAARIVRELKGIRDTLETSSRNGIKVQAGTSGSSAGLERSPTAATSGSSAGLKRSPTAGTSGSSAGLKRVPSTGTSGSSAGLERSPTAGTLGSSAELERSPTASTSGSSAGLKRSPPTATSGSPAGLQRSLTAGTSGSSARLERSTSTASSDSSARLERSPSAATSGSSAGLERSPPAATSGSSARLERSPTAGTSGSSAGLERSPTASNSEQSSFDTDNPDVKFNRVPQRPRYDFKFKTLFLGDTGVGKSCLFQKLNNPGFNINFIKTSIGIDIDRAHFQYDTKFVQMMITDTAGQEEYFSIQPMYLRGVHGIFLVFDLTREKTLLRLHRWIDLVEVYGSDAQILLVGNKVDETEKRQISKISARNFATHNGFPYVETTIDDYYDPGLSSLMNMYKKMTQMLVQSVDIGKIHVQVPESQNTVKLQPPKQKSKCRRCKKS